MPESRLDSGKVDPLVGKVISDRFRILAPIARGGMGAVYKAEQAPLGRLVALKVLSIKHDEQKDPEFRRRFFLEAATVAKLTHPNTVTVFDYGQGEDGIYYIAMELVNGRTMKKALQMEGSFSAERAINITKQIARSLREAHRLGVIHRDMKPGNVMLVDRDGEDYVKVLDFGLVKEVDREGEEEDLTQAGVFMGSPKYMSPEQIQGEKVDGRSDIYSVGVILYEMICGHPPFVRENPMQVLMDHVREPVPMPAAPEGKPPIGPGLVAVVLKCLEKKPVDRFPDMEALLVALKESGGELGLSMSQSRQLNLSGEYDLSNSGSTGTPVSGVHTVAPVLSPPAGMPSGSLPPAPSAAEERRGGRGALVAVAALAIVAVLAIGGFFAFGGGGSSSTAEAARPTPTTETATPPVTPPTEPPPVQEAVGTVTPPPPVEEPTIRTVLLSLSSNPAGAMVQIGEREYGPTPAQIELTGEQAEEGRELTLVFHRDGFIDATVTRVIQGSSLDISARLGRRSSGGGSRGGSTTGGSTTTGGTGEGSRDVHVDGYRDSPY